MQIESLLREKTSSPSQVCSQVKARLVLQSRVSQAGPGGQRGRGVGYGQYAVLRGRSWHSPWENKLIRLSSGSRLLESQATLGLKWLSWKEKWVHHSGSASKGAWSMSLFPCGRSKGTHFFITRLHGIIIQNSYIPTSGPVWTTNCMVILDTGGRALQNNQES
jgi:hypothetical protein